MTPKQWKILYWLSFFLVILPMYILSVWQNWDITGWVVIILGIIWRMYCRKRWSAPISN